jgi:hypothetical protein
MALLEEDSAFSELLDLESLDPSLLLRMTSFSELLDVTELLDFTLLLDTLVSLSLDFGVTLEELLDFALELFKSSQSSQADEESPLGRVAKLLSPSPQATSTAATKPIIRKRIKAINAPPNKHLKYTFEIMISAFLLQKMYSGVLGASPFCLQKT